MLTRREFLRASTALTAACATGALTGCPHHPQPIASTTPPGTPGWQSIIPPDLPTLREAGSSRNLLAGCAVNVPRLRLDPAYAGLIKQQAGIVVAENAMKFGPIQPGPTQFFFDDVDYLFGFAEENGIKVRGHNFVWHRAVPAWFDSYVTPANAEAVLVNHIRTVATRYAGRVQSWDVVNEAIDLKDNQPGGLRITPWFKLLGPAYLDIAFRAARQADPSALLCYNDYAIESQAPDQAAKRAAVLHLVRGLQQRGTPIDAVGIQSHISAGETYGPGLQQFMRDIQSLGLKIMLTEMDVNDRSLPGDLATRDHAVADLYRRYLNLTLASTDVIALLTWGITDRYTWLNQDKKRADNLSQRSLPFDADLRPTLAYVAEVQAIQQAPTRV